ncbi:MAG: hypothetical protein M1824_004715 [Vezdaea acicularis]|nr:MAG: hypothetical protein M1824_004715 [Vezdaea acicularis]
MAPDALFPTTRDHPSDRETYIRTTSRSIDGSYPLLDVLSLHTVSGSINTTVTPAAAAPDFPEKPASFNAQTTSGSIRVRFPLQPDELPERVYHTLVSSSVGSVGGSYVLGARNSFRTEAGSVDVVLLAREPAMEIPVVIETQSGRMSVDVRVSGERGTVMGRLEAGFRSNAGSVDVRYPESWAGELVVRTRSGSVDVVGEGVKVVRDEVDGGGERVVRAFKEGGTGRTEIRTVAGSIRFSAG